MAAYSRQPHPFYIGGYWCAGRWCWGGLLGVGQDGSVAHCSFEVVVGVLTFEFVKTGG
jgi:hypothetical protein